MLRVVRHVLVIGLFGACGPEPQGETAGASGTTGELATASGATGAFEPPPVSCPEDPTTDGSTGGVAELCPGRPATDACCCFRDLGPDSLGGTESVCGVAALCPTMRFGCSAGVRPNVASELLTAEDPAAIDCSLQALADGKAGRIAWAIGDAGFSDEHVEIELVGDGTAFRQGAYHIDLCVDVYAVERFPLPTSAFFTACLAAPEWRTRFDCVRQALVCSPRETCRDGYRPPPFPELPKSGCGRPPGRWRFGSVHGRTHGVLHHAARARARKH